ncbi:hypothetical protein Q7P35_001103 [Cladosporium inversicolor]
MLMSFRAAGTAAIVCLLSTVDGVLASPVYDNRTFTNTRNVETPSLATDSVVRTSSPNIGNYVMQGIAGATTRGPTRLPPPSGTSENTTPTTRMVDTYYTGQQLSDSIWHLFTSKTERPITPVSWASPMPEVEKCWSDIVTWRQSSISWWNKYIASTKFSNTVLSTETTIWAVTETAIETTIYPTSVSAYTLCDGSPRVDIRPQTSTITSNVSLSRTTVVPQEFAFPQTQPCIPDSRTCRRWYYESNINVTNEDELLQQCGHPTGLYEPCLVAGGPVQLIYWPEGNGESNICPNNASMVLHHPSNAYKMPAATLPDTITALGHTFTSGSVYLSFHTLYASYDGFYDRVGPTFKDTIIPVPSSAMSTHCGGFTEAHGPGTALNYADLNWPVAASAYNCQARCDNWRFVSHDNKSASAPECQTIWNDVNPNIVVPTLVRDLVPEWAHCEMSGFRIPNFWHDPPVALTAKASIAVPTLPTTQHAEPTQEPASPSPTIASAAPIETGVADDGTAGSMPSSTDEQPSKTSTRIDPTSNVGESQPSRTYTNEVPMPGEHETSTANVALPPPEHTTESANSASPGISNSIVTEEGDSKPTRPMEPPSTAENKAPSETMASSPPFKYQPEPTGSLNALSVLQSALSALSESSESQVKQSALPTSEGFTLSESIPDNAESSSSGTASDTTPTITSAENSKPQEQPGSTGNADAEDTTSTMVFEDPRTSGNDDPAATTSSRPNHDSSPTAEPTGVSTPAASGEDGSAEFTLPPVVQAAPTEYSTLVAADFIVTASRAFDSPDAVVLGGHTFHSDNPVATISGHVISALSSDIVLVSSDSAITFTRLTDNSNPTLVPLVAGSLTVTAEVAEGSSGAISIGGTTLANDGDFATLQDGYTVRVKSSGIEIARSNSTEFMSSTTMSGSSSTVPVPIATVVDASESAPSRTEGYPTEASEPADSAGEKSSVCLLGMGLMMLSVAYLLY